MLKAVFFDIDGTLVSFNTHRIPTSAVEAVSRIRRQGVKVFIATGRPRPFINNLAGLEYDGIVSVNGACCFTAEGEVISQKPVPKADIERLVEDAKAHPMPIAFATHDRAIAVNPDEAMGHLAQVFSLLDLRLPEIRPIEDALSMEVLQVIAFFTPEQEARIMRDVLKGCDANRWHPYFADCVAKGTSKATGIDAMCRHYGIAIEDTASFGDGGDFLLDGWGDGEELLLCGGLDVAADEHGVAGGEVREFGGHGAHVEHAGEDVSLEVTGV